MKDNYIYIAVSVLLMGPLYTLTAEKSEKPNFIIINIHDLGYVGIGSFGLTLNRTPAQVSNLGIKQKGERIDNNYG